MSLGKDLTTLLWKKEILDNNAFLIPGNLKKMQKELQWNTFNCNLDVNQR
jgi:hypothetical protein